MNTQKPCEANVKFFTCFDRHELITEDWDIARAIQRDVLRQRGWRVGDWATLTREYGKHRLFKVEQVWGNSEIQGRYPDGKKVGCLYSFHRAIWIPTAMQLWCLLSQQRRITQNGYASFVMKDPEERVFKGITASIALARALVTAISDIR